MGADNDTQGFRNNFTAIQSAFAVAASEVNDIQNNGVKLSQTNDFGDNILKGAVLQNYGELSVSKIATTTVTNYAYVTIDYSEASYHKVSLINSASTGTVFAFSILNWPPANRFGKLTLELKPSNTTTATVYILGNTKILGVNSGTVNYNQTSTIFYELWSTDNGASIYGTKLTG